MEKLAALVWAFIASYSAVRLAKPLALKTGLVDKPNERKHHNGSVPLVGGIAIFIGVISSSIIFLPASHYLNVYFVSAAVVLLLGVLDDKHDLKVSHRIAVQSLSACIMIYGADLSLESLGNILGPFDLNIGFMAGVLTVFAVVGAINAFNMVDGIDGLAGMLSITTFSGLGLLFILSENSAWIFPVIFISAILAYLTFNLGWPNSKAKKVFMGDAGSMLIGLSVVWMLIYGSQGDNAPFKPVIALWMVALPLMDMAAIMIRRLRKGQSPFKPDRDHLHHICMRAGLSDRQALAAITALSSTMIAFGVIGQYLDLAEWFMFVSFLLVFLVYNLSIKHVWKIMTFFKKL